MNGKDLTEPVPRFPYWLKRKLPAPEIMLRMKNLLLELNLHTICESARCPNMGKCFSRKTATFLISGDVCTRRCTFCAVKKGTPTPLNRREPECIFEAVKKLDLRYVVITSVTRDDLPDGGASQFVRVIRILRDGDNIMVEVLIPDFRGSSDPLRAVVEAKPQVINHNVETVPRLYPNVRPLALYKRSLGLLSEVKRMDPTTITKSGLMLGLGETRDEVINVMRDLRKADCDLVTIGQYLRPSSKHHPVVAFITPKEFSEYEEIGMEMGFSGIASAPLVRSSFRAEELYAKVKGNLEENSGD